MTFSDNRDSGYFYGPNSAMLENIEKGQSFKQISTIFVHENLFGWEIKLA